MDEKDEVYERTLELEKMIDNIMKKRDQKEPTPMGQMSQRREDKKWAKN